MRLLQIQSVSLICDTNLLHCIVKLLLRGATTMQYSHSMPMIQASYITGRPCIRHESQSTAETSQIKHPLGHAQTYEQSQQMLCLLCSPRRCKRLGTSRRWRQEGSSSTTESTVLPRVSPSWPECGRSRAHCMTCTPSTTGRADTQSRGRGPDTGAISRRPPKTTQYCNLTAD